MNERIRKAYIAGFVKRANAYGLDPNTLIKMASGAVTRAVAPAVTTAVTRAATKSVAPAVAGAAAKSVAPVVAPAVASGVMPKAQAAAERAAWEKREAERIAKMKKDIQKRHESWRRQPNGEYLPEYEAPGMFSGTLDQEELEKVLTNLGLVGLVGGTGAALGYASAKNETGKQPAVQSATPRRATMLELK